MSKRFTRIGKGLSLASLSTAPSDPENGDIYYDSGVERFQKYENGAWKDFGSGATVATSLAVANKTSNYTLRSLDDLVTADASGGAFTLTLPDPVANSGKRFWIKKIDSSTNVVTVSGSVSGATSRKLTKQYDWMRIVSDGANWYWDGGRTTSEILADTFNNYGSTATVIMGFGNFDVVGSAITQANTGAAGTTLTINEPGLYSISAAIQSSIGGQIVFGLTKNQSALTTGILSQSWGTRLSLAYAPPVTSESSDTTTAWSGYLAIGDVIRLCVDSQITPSATARCFLQIAKMSE